MIKSCLTFMRQPGAVLLALFSLSLCAVGQAAQVDLARYPSLSPNGATVVFSWRGDLWRAAATGGGAGHSSSVP